MMDKFLVSNTYVWIGEFDNDVEQLFDAGSSVGLIEVVAKSSTKTVQRRKGTGRIRVEGANESHNNNVEPFIQPCLHQSVKCI